MICLLAAIILAATAPPAVDGGAVPSSLSTGAAVEADIRAVDQARMMVRDGETTKGYARLAELAVGGAGVSRCLAVSAMAELAGTLPEARVVFLNQSATLKDKLEGDLRALLLLRIGSVYEAIGDYGNAREALSEGLRKHPDSPWSWSTEYRLAFLSHQEGRYRDCAEALRILERRGTGSAEQQRALGLQLLQCLFAAGEWQELATRAEAFLASAGEDENSLFVWDQLMAAHRELGDLVSAIRAAEHYLDLHHKLYPKPDEHRMLKRRHVETWLAAARDELRREEKRRRQLNPVGVSSGRQPAIARATMAEGRPVYAEPEPHGGSKLARPVAVMLALGSLALGVALVWRRLRAHSSR